MKHLTLAVPENLTPTAKLVALAFEPDYNDPSGYLPFSTLVVDAQGARYGYYGSLVEDWLADSVDGWKLAPDQLHAAVATRLADSYPSVTPPASAEVTEFANAVLVSTAYGVLAGLDELGLSLPTLP